MSLLTQFDQSEPPRKGIFTKLSVDECKSLQTKLCKRVIAMIEKAALRDKSYQFLVEWEKFQSDKKGPITVNFNDAVESYTKIFDASKSQLPGDDDSPFIESIIDEFKLHLAQAGVQGMGVKDFDHATAWAESDSTKLRGLPYDKSGNDLVVIGGKEYRVDDHLIRNMGNGMNSIITKTEEFLTQAGEWRNTSITRHRLQFPNKFRFIEIPPAALQYLQLPIVKDMTDVLSRTMT